jgi:hypothetical protein
MTLFKREKPVLTKQDEERFLKNKKAKESARKTNGDKRKK